MTIEGMLVTAQLHQDKYGSYTLSGFYLIGGIGLEIEYIYPRLNTGCSIELVVSGRRRLYTYKNWDSLGNALKRRFGLNRRFKLHLSRPQMNFSVNHESKNVIRVDVECPFILR